MKLIVGETKWNPNEIEKLINMVELMDCALEEPMDCLLQDKWLAGLVRHFHDEGDTPKAVYLKGIQMMFRIISNNKFTRNDGLIWVTSPEDSIAGLLPLTEDIIKYSHIK